MRTFSIAVQASLAARRLTWAMCCKATRSDGQVFGFTQLDINIPYGGVLYQAGALGFSMSATENSDQLKPDNHTVSGILNAPGITQNDILAGRWDYAELEFFQLNWRDLSLDPIPEAIGNVGNVSIGTLGFTVEFLDVKQRLGQNMLRVVSNMCDAVLGDARCGVDLGPFTRTATAAAADPTGRFFTDPARTEPDGWWSGGNLVCTASAEPLAVGLKMEIKSFTTLGGFELTQPLFYGILAGDQFAITPGCNYQKRMADGTFTGDCVVKYDNAVNFRGFDDVPGPDAALNYKV